MNSSESQINPFVLRLSNVIAWTGFGAIAAGAALTALALLVFMPLHLYQDAQIWGQEVEWVGCDEDFSGERFEEDLRERCDNTYAYGGVIDLSNGRLYNWVTENEYDARMRLYRENGGSTDFASDLSVEDPILVASFAVPTYLICALISYLMVGSFRFRPWRPIGSTADPT